MTTNLKLKNIKEILSEADELIRQINSDAIKDIEERHRLLIAKHAQHLKNVKSEVQTKLKEKEKFKLSDSAEGMHEAFQDISKAMVQLKKYLSGNRPDDVE